MVLKPYLFERWWSLWIGMVIACLLLSGCAGGGGTDTSTTGTTGTQTTGTVRPPLDDEATGTPMGGPAGAPGMMPGGPMGGMPGMPPMMGPGGMGMGFGAMGGGMRTAEAPAAQPPKNKAMPPNRRPDPFKPWWDTSIPPRPVLEIVPPLRLAVRDTVTPPEEKVEIQEVPNRRVAGILSGVGVYALIEGPEGLSIVKPGDMVGEYRVQAINPRSVTLRRTFGNQIFTQVVPLTDVTTAGQFRGVAPGTPGGPGLAVPGGLPGVPPTGTPGGLEY